MASPSSRLQPLHPRNSLRKLRTAFTSTTSSSSSSSKLSKTTTATASPARHHLSALSPATSAAACPPPSSSSTSPLSASSSSNRFSGLSFGNMSSLSLATPPQRHQIRRKKSAMESEQEDEKNLVGHHILNSIVEPRPSLGGAGGLAGAGGSLIAYGGIEQILEGAA